MNASEEPTVIEVDGDCDLWNKEKFEQLFERAAAAAQLVLNFARTRYIDAACLEMLARLQRTRLQRGLTSCRLVIPPGHIRKVFGIVGFDQIFPVFGSMSEALVFD